MVVLSAFRSAGQLGQCDHRNLQLFGHDLQRTGHFRNLLHTVINPPPGGHQLQIVDNHQIQVLHPAQAGFHFTRRNTGGVVNVNLRLG